MGEHAVKPGSIVAVSVDLCDGCEGDADKAIACFRCHQRGVRFRPLDNWGVVTKNDLWRILRLLERQEASPWTTEITETIRAQIAITPPQP